ncbi:glucosaminyl-phosphotidylinositol O-acyltransferase [Spizellomyces punctatus DAOM BR117]|uniref:GPI-anchored wall transfer protein n=1 Tax=Spizellomyces punctatus (strain DAOM BR117) TaxID=645134 RepID=A0A0L0HHC0_SPIPD|nr:glucosaminyl-phosphotidylinositol O-acyltransferase [Spizellomyces punctatus DAOM BR117]KND00467.1 hypothetical protein SPPG_04783 [Spizellomyces punctatus DAOM BR117]|eukprot:XP_016608506.1 hypothetical protein SPPG_04783 [Spizellomyces punctatus DAOM BR117]
MDEATRRAKEEHVTGHNGTSVLELQQVLTVTLLSYALWKAVTQTWHPGRRSMLLEYSCEFATLVLPFLLSVTTEWKSQTLAALLLATVFVSCLPVPQHVEKAAKNKPTKSIAQFHLPFLTPVRGCLQVVTIICILAVDFRVFPRRFAKTETFGTSLMDLGVGLFIFSGGVVAGPRLKTTAGEPIEKLYKSIKLCTPVMILGVARMILTKGVNYQEHVTEYGVHWNFFMTLALIPLVITILQLLAPGLSFTTLAVVISVAYTILLQNMGLERYIMEAPRDNIFSMNREGICSFFGYLAIFLLAADIGARLRMYTTHQTVPVALPQILRELLAILISLSIAFAVATQILGIQVSRRLANISYVLWVSLSGVYHVSGCALIDLLYGTRAEIQTPLLYKAINRNQLAIFLVGNLLTGLVNLSVNTLEVSDSTAYAILTLYIFIVGGVAVILDHLNLTLKL